MGKLQIKMGWEKFKNNSASDGVRDQSKTISIEGDIIKTGQNSSITNVFNVIEKKSIIVSDDTIAAESLQFFETKNRQKFW